MPISKTSLILLLAAGVVAATFGIRGQRHRAPAAPGVPSFSALRSEGRVVAYPGSDVMVGTDVSGTLTRMLVQEGDHVRKGQLLALLDARLENADLREAQSRIKELEADIRFLETELRRNESLHGQGITSRQSLDQASNQLALIRARRDAAQATADRMETSIAKRSILAPIDGVVMTRYAHGGETVAQGAKLLQIADSRKFRIEAEVDEFDLAKLHMGAQVQIRAEGYGEGWKGAVEEIPFQVVGRRLKPQDPARPSDTRILPVRVALQETTPLKLGQRVEIEIL